jgi:mRNA interferase MazF
MLRPKRGDIWLTDLEPARGDEMRKTRPAVVVSEDSIGVLDLCIIVPVTEWKDRYAVAPWMIRIEPAAVNGLTKASSADAFQIRSISVDRLRRQIGTVTEDILDSIAAAVALCVGYQA